MKWIIASALFFISVTSLNVFTRELDSFSHRNQYGHILLDSADALDAWFEAKMRLAEKRLEKHEGPISQKDWFLALKKTLLSRLTPWLISPIEMQIERTDWIPKFIFEDRGILGPGITFDDMGFAWYIALASVIRVRGVYVGVDKVGHFVSQGLEYLSASLEGGRSAALRLGHSQEIGQMGAISGGVYSFADLAANYAGMTYFETVRKALEKSRSAPLPKMSHFVTSEWDEALNPSWIPNSSFFQKLTKNLREYICPSYRSNPRFFKNPHPQEHVNPQIYLSESSQKLLTDPQRLDIRKICGMTLRTL